MVPGHLVPHNWSLINWSLWTNGPQPIQSPWTNGPPKFGLHGKWSPKIRSQWTNGPQPIWPPLTKRFLEYFICPGGQAVGIWKYGDQISWGPYICPGEPNFGGPFVHGD